MNSFADKLSETDRKLADKLRQIVLTHDRAVEEQPRAIMSAKDALCYSEGGVMKYGFARTKSGYTFHSMVMYANPDVAEFVREKLEGVKQQKGCFNFPSLAEFDFAAFEDLMRLSATKDFSPVLDHYRNQKRKRQG